MDRVDMKKLLVKVRENQQKLKDCKGPHRFTGVVKSGIKRFRCVVCGGDVNSINKNWYERGLEHGRKL